MFFKKLFFKNKIQDMDFNTYKNECEKMLDIIAEIQQNNEFVPSTTLCEIQRLKIALDNITKWIDKNIILFNVPLFSSKSHILLNTSSSVVFLSGQFFKHKHDNHEWISVETEEKINSQIKTITYKLSSHFADNTKISLSL